MLFVNGLGGGVWAGYLLFNWVLFPAWWRNPAYLPLFALILILVENLVMRIRHSVLLGLSVTVPVGLVPLIILQMNPDGHFPDASELDSTTVFMSFVVASSGGVVGPACATCFAWVRGHS
jgi:hypothetical protein